jgi:mannose-6-phosphate isomerase-like protein (cupin superfamily)
MKPDFRNIESDTLKNNNYRKVIYTVPNELQLVLMSLAPGEDIPVEVHNSTTQFIRVESGSGYVHIGTKKYNLKDGVSIVIPPKKKHYVKNTSKNKSLKLYTIYTPPEHPKNLIQKKQPK